MARPSFGRVWIAQELYKACDATLCCAADTVWFEVFQGYVWLINDAEKETKFEGQSKILSAYGNLNDLIIWLAKRHLAKRPLASGDHLGLTPKSEREAVNLACQDGHTGYSLVRCLRLTCLMECEDARDKLCAICGLLSRLKPDIIPDYSKSAFTLAAEVMEAHTPIKEDDHMFILALLLVWRLNVTFHCEDVWDQAQLVWCVKHVGHHVTPSSHHYLISS